MRENFTREENPGTIEPCYRTGKSGFMCASVEQGHLDGITDLFFGEFFSYPPGR